MVQGIRILQEEAVLQEVVDKFENTVCVWVGTCDGERGTYVVQR